MRLWLARDKGGDLRLFIKKPKRVEHIGMFDIDRGNDYVFLDETEFSEVTWENSPKEVELNLI